MMSKTAALIRASRPARSFSLTRTCRPSSVSNKFEAGPVFSKSLIRRFYRVPSARRVLTVKPRFTSSLVRSLFLQSAR